MAHKRISSMYFMVDSRDDLTYLPESQMGTTCFVIEDACEYKCTSDGRWIPQMASSAATNPGAGGNVDLTGYATEGYVDTKIANLVGSAPENLNTLHEIAVAFKENGDVLNTLNEAIGEKANRSEIPDVSIFQEKGDYALKSEIPDLTDYALKEELPEIPNLEGYALKSELPDLTNYARKEEIPEIPSLDAYALKSEIPSVAGLATEQYVNEAIAEIEGVEIPDTLPSYWKEYLPAKIATINTVNEAAGYNGASLIFLTDTHWPANNNHSIDLINEVIEGTSVRKVFFGGDMLECDNKDSSIVTLGREKEKKLNEKAILYPIRGNHDTTSSACKDTHWWDIFYGRLANRNVDVGQMYYYDDDNAHKIRYICLDMIAPEGALTSYFTTQLDWMEQRIKELNSGWNVVVVGHSVWGALKVGTITTWGQALLDRLDTLCGNVKANIIAIISGHVHDDGAIQRAKGYVVISTDADRQADGGTGDTTEQAFDVMNINVNTHKITLTRIGRGNDRNISYVLNGNASAGNENPDGEDTVLNTIDITSKFNFDGQGYIQSTNGAVMASDANWAHNTVPINVSNYEQLILTIPTSGNSSTSVGYAFYDESNKFISGAALYSGTQDEYVEKTITINVPVGAVYFKTSIMTPVYDKYYDDSWTFVAKATTENEVEEDVTLVNEDFTTAFNFDDNGTGYVKYADGTVVSTDLTQNPSGYVDIEKYDTIEVTVPMSNSATTPAGCAFYDADKNYVSGSKYTYTAGDAALETKTLTIPANAKYFRTALRNSGHAHGADDRSAFKAIGYYQG